MKSLVGRIAWFNAIGGLNYKGVLSRQADRAAASLILPQHLQSNEKVRNG